MQNQDDTAASVAGPVAGGAAIIGGVAAVAYTANTLAESDLLTEPTDPYAQFSTLQNPAASPGSEAEAARFLLQATHGPTRRDINFVAANGISAWLTLQYATGRGKTHWQYLRSLGTSALAQRGGGADIVWDKTIWRQLIAWPDQLRQRVAMALLDIMVVSVNTLTERYPQWALAAYMDLLLNHAFGNFRNLLGAITTSSAMGQTLTFITSSKADSSGLMPDENYARELMQLFTLGLYQLNMDGTLRLDSRGEPIETYTEEDVTQLARVFTGLRLAGSDRYKPDAHGKPLIVVSSKNETGPSTFLNRTVSGGGMNAINNALDVIFQHGNLPPFFARALIQRLVTSNPSPAYIERVAKRFANNGSGVRGDMKAIITAVLTDPEARSTQAIAAPHTGRLRDPTQRITGFMRAFNATSETGSWPIRDMSDLFLHSPGRSPSVFNFFRPGYSPPNSELQRRGLVAPELQITDEQSVLAYLNFIYQMVRVGRGDARPNYSSLHPLADNAEALFDEINLRLAAGQLSSATRSIVVGALKTMGSGSSYYRNLRIWTAVMLTMSAPEYLVIQ